ncbi:hypothetical protein CPC08DRAFT_763474 [Agrocybe pediades]|nr:hypothetical protein CPC08DRAFT_763474 [Agrocybe pediades]
MQSLRPLSRLFRNSACARARYLSLTAATHKVQQQSTTPIPWFIDPQTLPQSLKERSPPPHIPITPKSVPTAPEDAPEVLKHLHADLVKSPHLELSELVVSSAVAPAPGPALPLRSPRGRRKRGGTYAGESAYEIGGGGLWNWVVVAQVKEGTENRGAIESVIRLVRKSLLSRDPPVPLAPKRRANGSEWVLIDAGDIAIHILSKAAREKYFNQSEW